MASKKESILDLSKYLDQNITVKFVGGREGFSSISSFSVIYFDIYLASDGNIERI